MLKTMMSVSRNELLQKLDPLEQAKVDLVSAHTLNSMFWVYLATQGVNPKEHPVKQELERIRVYMNRVKQITDQKRLPSWTGALPQDLSKMHSGNQNRIIHQALLIKEKVNINLLVLMYMFSKSTSFFNQFTE
ncbi:Nuclear nucleic acid-binding protein C1D [Lemmus lemmus]